MNSQKQLRFTGLKLTNWRNFRTVDIQLGEQAYIVGPNASGKSNLIDALRFISEIAKPGSGGLQAAVQRRDGMSALRCLHARNPAYIEIEAAIGTSVSPCQWRYLLRIHNGGNGKEKLPTVRLEQVTCDNESIVNRQRGAGDDQLEYSQTSLEQVGQSVHFRPLIEFLSSCRYLHVVPQIVRDRTRAKASGDDPYGGDLLGRIKDMPKKMREPRLQRMAAALQIAVPQFNSIQLEDDAQGVPHLWASFEHWRATNARQSESYFSDGTLRLIGLLWSIAERGGPLLLEEPELSLNDAVVSQLPSMFRKMQRLSGRQVITTTHSAVMLDNASVGLSEVHHISVGVNGSTVETLTNNQTVTAQTQAGLSTSEAVLPLLAPFEIDRLGSIDIAA